jgi:hypothetical protein
MVNKDTISIPYGQLGSSNFYYLEQSFWVLRHNYIRLGKRLGVYLESLALIMTCRVPNKVILEPGLVNADTDMVNMISFDYQYGQSLFENL